MEDQFEDYTIPIDGRWSLEDLYRFPRAYEQVYFALEAIIPAENQEVEERIEYAFRAYPWQGGYSAVSFYNQLKFATPIRRRPVIRRMHYASPGLIELYLNLPLAVQLGSIVTSVAGSIGICNKVYNSIYADLQKRELLKIEVERKRIELSREEIEFVTDASETMAKLMDIPSVAAIHARTGNPLISLKILLSVYRRIRILADYKIRGKANLRSINEMIEDGDL
jgi:RNA-binding protein YhbY